MSPFEKAGLVAVVLGGVLASAASTDAAETRVYAVGSSGLELTGASAGFVKDAGGGSAYGDLRVTQPVAGAFPKKQLVGVKWQDVTFAAGAGLKPAFYEWVRDTLKNPAASPRKDGAVVMYDYAYKPVGRTNFRGAFISGIEFGAFEAASKDAGKMLVSLTPQSTSRVVGGTAPAVAAPSTAARWMASNFRLRIDGFEAATARTRRIEPIGVRLKTAAAAVGEDREYLRTSVSVDVSNLVIELAEADAGPFYRWHEEFVVGGRNTDDRERRGTLEILSPTLQTMFTLTFSNIGIIQVSPAGSEQVRTARVEMYFESLAFDFTPAAL